MEVVVVEIASRVEAPSVAIVVANARPTILGICDFYAPIEISVNDTGTALSRLDSVKLRGT